jgi:hypothetical protein
MIMEVIEGFWSILCNIGSEKGITARLNVVTDVVYPEHDGVFSKTHLRCRKGGEDTCHRRVT